MRAQECVDCGMEKGGIYGLVQKHSEDYSPGAGLNSLAPSIFGAADRSETGRCWMGS